MDTLPVPPSIELISTLPLPVVSSAPPAEVRLPAMETSPESVSIDV